MTGPSTVGWVGSSCFARVMSADAGIIIGRISEIMGNKELIIDSLREFTAISGYVSVNNLKEIFVDVL
jgi:hypothetical protein